MPTHVLHILEGPKPFEIDFFPELWWDKATSDLDVSVVSVSPSVDERCWPLEEDGRPARDDRWSKPDVFVVSRSGRAWAFGDAEETLAFLIEQGAPIPDGLAEALAADRTGGRPTRDGRRRHWEPDLLNAEGYTVYTAVWRAVGEGCDYDAWGGVDEAIDNASPSYHSGSASVQVGSLPVWRTSASGGGVDPRSDGLTGQTRTSWEHPALEALKEREAAMSSRPAFG